MKKIISLLIILNVVFGLYNSNIVYAGESEYVESYKEEVGVSLFSYSCNESMHWVLMNNDVKCADVVITIYFEYADGDWVEVNDVLLDIDCYNGYSVSVSPNKYFNNGNDSGYCRRIISFLNSSGTHYEYYLYAYADCYGNVDFNTVINRVY